MLNVNKIIITLLCILFITSPITAAFGHGVTGTVSTGMAVIAEIRYDDGEPFSYSQAKIFSPDNKKIEYLNSRTDARGILSFVPDKKGLWKISVTDGMSHGKELEINITEDLTGTKSVNSWGEARKEKLIKAFLLIWAVVATSSYIYARSKNKLLS